MDISVVRTTSTYCSAAATCLNALLIPIIIFRSGPDIGSYKYMLMLYTTSSLISSAVILTELPILLPSSHGFLFLSSVSRFSKIIGNIAMVLHGACYALWTVILTLSFIYRMLIIRKREHILFTKWTVPAIIGFVTFLVVLFANMCLIAPTPIDTLDAYTPHVLALTGYPISELSYCGGEFFNDPNDRLGTGFWISATFAIFVVPCFVIIIYCATKTYKWFQSTRNVTTSRRILHKKIFCLLLLQTTFPLVFAFIPVLVATVLAIFSVDLPDSVNLTYSALLPVAQLIDPVLIFLFVDDYRSIFPCFSKE